MEELLENVFKNIDSKIFESKEVKDKLSEAFTKAINEKAEVKAKELFEAQEATYTKTLDEMIEVSVKSIKLDLEEKFDDVKSINGENVVIQKNGKYGIMTISGDTKLETKYEDIKFTYADNYIAKLEGKYGIVNVAGQTKLDFVYNNLIYRSDVDFYEGTKENINSDLIDRDFNVKLNSWESLSGQKETFITCVFSESKKKINSIM